MPEQSCGQYPGRGARADYCQSREARRKAGMNDDFQCIPGLDRENHVERRDSHHCRGPGSALVYHTADCHERHRDAAETDPGQKGHPERHETSNQPIMPAA